MNRITRQQALEHIARRGDVFRADIYDRSLRQIDVSRKHHVHNSLVSCIRIAIFGPKIKRLKVDDPRVLRVLRADITSAEAARKLKCNQTTVSDWRKRLGIPPRVTPALRLTDDVLLMLRSQLPTTQVARALNIAPSTVDKHRRALKTAPRRIVATKAELEAMTPEILAAKSTTEAVRKFGISYSTAQIIRRQHGIPGRRLRRHDLPTDPSWYSDKTLPEIAAYLNTTPQNASYLVRVRGFKSKDTRGTTSYAQRSNRRIHAADSGNA